MGHVADDETGEAGETAAPASAAPGPPGARLPQGDEARSELRRREQHSRADRDHGGHGGPAAVRAPSQGWADHGDEEASAQEERPRADRLRRAGQQQEGGRPGERGQRSSPGPARDGPRRRGGRAAAPEPPPPSRCRRGGRRGPGPRAKPRPATKAPTGSAPSRRARRCVSTPASPSDAITSTWKAVAGSSGARASMRGWRAPGRYEARRGVPEKTEGFHEGTSPRLHARQTSVRRGRWSAAPSPGASRRPSRQAGAYATSGAAASRRRARTSRRRSRPRDGSRGAAHGVTLAPPRAPPLHRGPPAGVEAELRDVVEHDRAVLPFPGRVARGETQRADGGERPLRLGLGRAPGPGAGGGSRRRGARPRPPPSTHASTSRRAEPVTAKPELDAWPRRSPAAAGPRAGAGARGSPRRVARCRRAAASRGSGTAGTMGPATTRSRSPRRTTTGPSSVRRSSVPSPRSPASVRSGRTRASASGTTTTRSPSAPSRRASPPRRTLVEDARWRCQPPRRTRRPASYSDRSRARASRFRRGGAEIEHEQPSPGALARFHPWPGRALSGGAAGRKSLGSRTRLRRPRRPAVEAGRAGRRPGTAADRAGGHRAADLRR